MISSELQVRSLNIRLQQNDQMELAIIEKSCNTLCNARWQDGVHVAKKDQEEMMTEEQKKVMRTQDIKYVEMKRVAEAKVSFHFPGLHHLLPWT